MLCSNCQNFEVHLPGADNLICERGHIFCESCTSLFSTYGCLICGGKIIKRTQYVIEGRPRMIDTTDRKENVANDKVAFESDTVSDMLSNNFSELFAFLNTSKSQTQTDSKSTLDNAIKEIDYLSDISSDINVIRNFSVIDPDDRSRKASLVNWAEKSTTTDRTKLLGEEVDLYFLSEEEKNLYFQVIRARHKSEIQDSPRYNRIRTDIEEFYRRPNYGLVKKSSENVSVQTDHLVSGVTYKDEYKENMNTQNDISRLRAGDTYTKLFEKVEDLSEQTVNVGTTIRTSLQPKLLPPRDGSGSKEPAAGTAMLKRSSMQKRDKAVHDLKTTIQEKVRAEIYSVFDKPIEDPSKYVLKPEKKVEVDGMYSYLPSKGSTTHSIPKERAVETIGISTESYPKLLPHLSIVHSSKIQPTERANNNLEALKEIEKQFKETESRIQDTGTIGSGSTKIEGLLNVSNFNAELQDPITNDKTGEEVSEEPKSLTSSGHSTPRTATSVDSSTLASSFEQSIAHDNAIDGTKKNPHVYYVENISNFPPQFDPANPKIPVDKIYKDFELKMLAKQLSADYREQLVPKTLKTFNSFDFVQYIREKLPEGTVDAIRNIILNCTKANTETQPKTPSQPSGHISPDTKKRTTIVTAWYVFPDPPDDATSEPKLQMRPIKPFCRKKGESSLQFYSQIEFEVRKASELAIPREPITCPMTSCKKHVFVSEFSYHIRLDHMKIPMEIIRPGLCKNLFIDPRADRHGVNKCSILYLISEKIKDLGSKAHKDYLPLLVMSTKVSLFELLNGKCAPDSCEALDCPQQYVMIWLTGLVPNDLPIYYTLTLWSRTAAKSKYKCQVTHSGKLYSLRNGQSCTDLYRKGHGILLSHQQCQLLMNGGSNFIELQTLIH